MPATKLNNEAISRGPNTKGARSQPIRQRKREGREVQCGREYDTNKDTSVGNTGMSNNEHATCTWSISMHQFDSHLPQENFDIFK